MDAACKWAIAKGATDCELNLHEFNQPAIAFYEKLSYKAAEDGQAAERGAGRAEIFGRRKRLKRGP